MQVGVLGFREPKSVSKSAMTEPSIGWLAWQSISASMS